MLNHFRILPFLGGILLAILVFAVYKPQKQEVKEYPHPKDVKEKVFKDPNGTCYSYTVHEVGCDANEGTLKDYPIQG
jgi:hypothetical protein